MTAELGSSLAEVAGGTAACLAAGALLSLALRRLDYDFGAVPEALQGFEPRQPWRLAPPGVAFEAVLLIADFAVCLCLASALAVGGQVLCAVLVIFLLLLAFVMQITVLGGTVSGYARELRRTLRRGGVATARWADVKAAEALVEATSSGLVASAGLAWVASPAVWQAALGLFAVLSSARRMADQALSYTLGAGDVGGARECAARASVRTARRGGALQVFALQHFMAAALAGHFAGFAVVVRVMSLSCALALQLPAAATIAMTSRRARPEGNTCGSLLVTLATPLAFIVPGGAAGADAPHSIFGLRRGPESPRRVYLVQLASCLLSIALCCSPLPEVCGRELGRHVLEQEFLVPARRLLFGTARVEDLGREVFHTGLLVIWAFGSFVQVLGTLIILACCPCYMAGGAEAVDEELLSAVNDKQLHLEQWCLQQEKSMMEAKVDSRRATYEPVVREMEVGDRVVYANPEGSTFEGTEQLMDGSAGVVLDGDEFVGVRVLFDGHRAPADVEPEYLSRENANP